MRDTALLQRALGLTPPWTVNRADFDPEAHRLDLQIDFAPGSRFACPSCGATDCRAHDTERKTWRHLNFFQHQAYLTARVPRIRCDACGIKTVHVPWARPGSGFTLLFEALVMTMLSAMPVAAVARIVGEHDTRLWRVMHHYVEQARARIDTSDVARIAIDETAARRGHNYITLNWLRVSLGRQVCLKAAAELDLQPVLPDRVETSFLEGQNGWKPPLASDSDAIGSRIV
jgi:transposase